MADRIVVHMQDRTVHWVVGPQVLAILLQNLVQGLGPAEEGDGS